MSTPAQPSPEQLIAHFEALAQQQPTAQIWFTLAALHQHLKQLEQAAAAYEQGLALEPRAWEAHLTLAGIRTVQGLHGQAAFHYQQVLQWQPEHLPAWFGLVNLLARERAHEEMAICYAEMLKLFPQLRQTPSIYFNTLPRSGSIYLTTTLRMMLRREFLMTAEIDSAANQVYEPNLRLFAQGGVISQAHLPASAHNLDLFNRHLDKLVVHVRDPRQATLSLVHLFRQRQGAGAERLHFEPPLPPDYSDWDLAAQIDWNLEYYYPVLIDWISGWLDVAEQGLFRGQLLLTRYEDFLADARGFFARIFGFYGLEPVSDEIIGYTPPPGYMNYRKGSLDEWRQEFSPAQIDRAESGLPPRLRRWFAEKS